MRIVIAGGSGFLGRALSSVLLAAGYRLQILTRHAAQPDTTTRPSTTERITWTPDGTLGPWAEACAGADAVINLAGESIGTARWSPARKARLADSRILATRSLMRFITETGPPPAAFVSASAVGIYGDRGDEVLTEEAQAGSDFLASLVVSWEREALRAQSGTTRVVLLRSGLVLDQDEGALARMLTPFRLFAGGPFGPGRQYMSWIHRDDWVALVCWVLATPGVRGPINMTAPYPVTNATFARTLGHTLRRPALVPVPSFVLKLALGEMAAPLLLFSQRVVPERALKGGYHFAYETLAAALADLLRRQAEHRDSAPVGNR